MFSDVVTVLMIVFGAFAALRFFEHQMGHRLFESAEDCTDQLERLSDKHEKEMQALEARYEERVRDLERRIDFLVGELQRAGIQIRDLENKIRNVPVTRQDKQVILAIWPDASLDLEGARNAIRSAGLAYRPLIKQSVSQSNILANLRRGDVGILEIGAHGDADGVLVNGLHLDADFWRKALQRYPVQIALVLACFSDLSVADAIKDAGAQYVIAATGEIEDRAAVAFAKEFYTLIAAGMDAPLAYDEAKLVLDYNQAELLTLR